MNQLKEIHPVSRLMDVSEVAIQSPLAVLSLREKEVLDLILEGHINKVIGDKLGISRRTVEAHRASIFHKTNVRNAMELVRLLKSNP
jgi:two-component system response regulator DctR